ncbi:hypothetical protein KUTeg_017154 [Tegillarca granosa]|uniref:Uncharacterized protein n=1 Tax=Tegillarca granosa TaxID=220873 RepID=A0ABQ9EN31_TEGGR|nr:hypothetical protein KUTeg_017154 [Tegillarca granosa]
MVASDERTKDGFVRVIVGTKGLKTSRKLKGMKLVKVADNANIDLQFPSERYVKIYPNRDKPLSPLVSMAGIDGSFCLTVEGGQKTSLKGKCFQLKINRLPHEINTNKSYFELKNSEVLVSFLLAQPDEDRVLLFLNKKQDKSWYPEMESGLEMEEED